MHLPTLAHSSIFKALFTVGTRTIKVDLPEHQGADGNFLSRQFLVQIKKSQSDITEKPLSTNQFYRDITGLYF